MTYFKICIFSLAKLILHEGLIGALFVLYASWIVPEFHNVNRLEARHSMKGVFNLFVEERKKTWVKTSNIRVKPDFCEAKLATYNIYMCVKIKPFYEITAFSIGWTTSGWGFCFSNDYIRGYPFLGCRAKPRAEKHCVELSI